MLDICVTSQTHNHAINERAINRRAINDYYGNDWQLCKFYRGI